MQACGDANHRLADQFRELWEKNGSHPDVFEFLATFPELPSNELVGICAIDQAFRWKNGCGIPAEDYLVELLKLQLDADARLALAVQEFNCQFAYGQNPEISDFARRFPDLVDKFNPLVATTAAPSPRIQQILEMSVCADPNIETKEAKSPPHAASSLAPAAGSETPLQKIGRYSIFRLIGDGGFGRVYLGHDDILNRDVAIKVPHAHRITGPADIEMYLAEARILARLDHPSIVPVFDCGSTPDGLCFVVSKYIQGGDLASKFKRSPLTYSAAAELIAKVAEALHYAHLHGVVHRDVKPANILIDAQDRPVLADFGIALRDEDYGTGYRMIGTVSYMSPEQVRSEGHLVDGRSDVFSLGAVLYELLTSRRPFPANRLKQPEHLEPRPPRQIDDSIPKELERICLKALSYRLVDRYSTASDFAADLKLFLKDSTEGGNRVVVNPSSSDPPIRGTSGIPSVSVVQPMNPKGLRSFDQHDSHFFLNLLPGPRNRDGLPESVHFWKTRILEQDPEKAFRAGLVIGPSGCGKSSFLKAAVLPSLGNDVVTVYVESTRLDTETRLLKALRKECPFLGEELNLVESLGAIRRGREPGKKVLIVLDQFEQWLHSRTRNETAELVLALRQCDGVRLQCLVSVRDDFWLTVTQFMAELEVELVPHENVAVLDLFSVRHARKILMEIGHAYGTVPANWDDMSEDQRKFIKDAVNDLARDNQIVPVQLALFAEMVKDKPWQSSTLKEIGGGSKVGVRFLEETFNGRTASPSHRLHQKGARSVLKELLSDYDQIKGSMQSYQNLLHVAGYENREKEFDTLIRILDSELRLITPTDPEGRNLDSVSSDAGDGRERFYHLTHDYLVPSLQEWLTYKQRETRRGRAELLLSERAGLWRNRPSRQNLLSAFELASVLCFVPSVFRRGGDERSLIRASARYHGTWFLTLVCFLGFTIAVIKHEGKRSQMTAAIESLEHAIGAQDVPRIMERLSRFDSQPVSRLRELLKASPADSSLHLHTAMALIPHDTSQVPLLFDRMLMAPAADFVALSELLAKHGQKERLQRQLSEKLADEKLDAAQRFRAAAALAGFEQSNGHKTGDDWAGHLSVIARQFIVEIRQHPASFGIWINQFRSISSQLVASCKEIYFTESTPSPDRTAAVSILAEYLSEDLKALASLIIQSTAEQYEIMIPKFRRHRDEALTVLLEIFREKPADADPLTERLRKTRKRAFAAVTMLDLENPEPFLESAASQSDPDLRTYSRDRLCQLVIRPEYLLQQLEQSDPFLRGSLLSTLGAIDPSNSPPRLQKEIIRAATKYFEQDADAGVHSAAEWLLRRSHATTDALPASVEPVDDRSWYVTPAGHTMIVFRGPIKSVTGSPESELSRDKDEKKVERIIQRDFAISSAEVSLEQFVEAHRQFRHKYNRAHFQSGECAAALLTWHHACVYCVWRSKNEGIPAEQICYDLKDGVATPFADYLHRTGYRLPTEAEWEYACRAGSSTPYSWGSDPDMSKRYSWSLANSDGVIQSVAISCPNPFGFYDMHGNVQEWTQDPYREEIGHVDEQNDSELPLDLFDADSDRVMRGGHAIQHTVLNRSANRTPINAKSAGTRFGFRIARTIRASTSE